jgi:hypothetical protein
LLERSIDAPIVFAGCGVRRTDAEAAGGRGRPAGDLRDVVTVGRLLRGQPLAQRSHIIGSLAEVTGVFTLVRALSTLGRSAVLTLIRGLRRGEVRFYHGEVTSAQVGLIHGQAAFHQLLLWTDARFDFRHEDVVRRQQIPLSPAELFADAERFLVSIRDSSGTLSPSMVLEQDVARIHTLGTQVPTEVHGVLRMFDGHRVLADVLEDSPYRVFETLRVTQRAVDAGLLRQASTPRPKATWRAVLAIEEWLVGDAREPDQDPADSGPLKSVDSTGPKKKESRRKRRKRRANTPLVVPAIQTKPDIDWGALVPRIVGADVGGNLAGVVPASHASGEIMLPTRDEPREKLEALMDTGTRARIFQYDVEPTIVFDELEDLARMKREHAEAEARAAEAKAREAHTAATKALEDAKAAAEAATWARAQAEAEGRAATDARAAVERAEAKADAKVADEAKAAAEKVVGRPRPMPTRERPKKPKRKPTPTREPAPTRRPTPTRKRPKKPKRKPTLTRKLPPTDLPPTSSRPTRRPPTRPLPTRPLPTRPLPTRRHATGLRPPTTLPPATTPPTELPKHCGRRQRRRQSRCRQSRRQSRCRQPPTQRPPTRYRRRPNRCSEGRRRESGWGIGGSRTRDGESERRGHAHGRRASRCPQGPRRRCRR